MMKDIRAYWKNSNYPNRNREVPIIADEYVDKEFGSGCVKITPAHDFNDYEIGLKHDLEVISCMKLDGTMSEMILCQKIIKI